jgi:hypothetical protein
VIFLEGKVAGSIRCADEDDDGDGDEVNLVCSTTVDRKANKNLVKVWFWARSSLLGGACCIRQSSLEIEFNIIFL